MGGLARRATAIAQLREQHEHVLLLDSGESLFRGGDSTESENPKQGALIVATMNAMGYDALALGERDLDAPLSTVKGRFEEADFPILSANVQAGSALPNVQPCLLYRAGRHTVAIVGATSETAGQRLEALGLDRPQDLLAAVDQAVQKAKRRADVVVVLSNLQQSEVEALAQAVPGIEAIVGVHRGGQRTPVVLPGAEGEVVLHSSGTEGKYLGVLNLQLDAQGRVTGFDGHALSLTDFYPDDPAMVELIRDQVAGQ